MMKKFTKGQTVEYFTNGNYTKGNIAKLRPLCIETWMGLIKISNKELLRACYVLMIMLLPALAQGQINGTLQKTSATGIIRGSFGSIGIDTLVNVKGSLTNTYMIRYNSTSKGFEQRSPAQVLSDIGGTGLASFSATSPIFYNPTTGVISSQAASAILDGYVTIGTQTIAGSKTFSGSITGQGASFTTGSFSSTITASDISGNNYLFNNNNSNTVGALSGNKPANIYSYGYNLSGSTSGMISFLGQAAAGTYNFNLPITAGTAGHVLTSQGGGASAMTWTTPATGTVTAIGVTTANGVSGTSSGGSTPNLTLTLGDITPSSVISAGLVRGIGAYGLSSRTASNTVNSTTGISFDMLNSSSVDTRYATMQGVIVANTAGAEFGRAEIYVMSNGTLLKAANFDQAGNLQVTNNITATGNISAANLASGKYAPTYANVANTTSVSSGGNSFYQRIGNIVNVRGFVTFQTVLAGIGSTISVNLPVASDFTTTVDAFGDGPPPEASTVATSSANIVADAASNLAYIQFISLLATTNGSFMYSFSYEIK